MSQDSKHSRSFFICCWSITYIYIYIYIYLYIFVYIGFRCPLLEVLSQHLLGLYVFSFIFWLLRGGYAMTHTCMLGQWLWKLLIILIFANEMRILSMRILCSTVLSCTFVTLLSLEFLISVCHQKVPHTENELQRCQIQAPSTCLRQCVTTRNSICWTRSHFRTHLL
jgi:hypothetical protein